jgi:hypothetical protein
MAILAEGHRKRLLLGYYIFLGNRPVAELAIESSLLNMNLVRKTGEAGELIDLNPRYGLMPPGICRELLDGRTPHLNCLMASHTSV